MINGAVVNNQLFMIWLLKKIVILSCVGLLLMSCNGPREDEPIWQQVKIGDLAPSGDGTQRSRSQLLKTINFNVYIFEIPTENISTLNAIREMLYTKPLTFNDSAAFVANSFSVGFGQMRMWDKITNLLRNGGGKKIETVSLLLSSGRADEFVVSRLNSKQTIFYISTAGSMEDTTVGPGVFILRIKAVKVYGSRGVCKVTIQPMFSPPIRSSIPQLAAHAKSRELLFDCCDFGLKMSPGDFFFLGPKHVSGQTTLADYFFSVDKAEMIVRAFLFVYTGIND